MESLKNTIKKYSQRYILLLLVAIHLLFLINLKFTAWPEMVAWPYLMIKGWLPYRDIGIAHTPLLLADLAIFNKIFGIGLMQLKIYTWILILLTDFLVYFVAKKLYDAKTALLALLFYIPLQVIYEGNGLWFDLALAPFALFVFYSLKKSKYFWGGFWFCLAVLTKQTAFWLAVPIIIHTLQGLAFKGVKNYIYDMTKGILIPFSVFFIVLLISGLHVFFYKWAIEFGIFYLPRAGGQVLLPTIKQLAVSMFPFAILIPLIFRNKKKDADLIIWSAFAGLGVYPRFELFHFQPALPFLAIGAGIAVVQVMKNPKLIFRIALAAYLLILLVISGRYVNLNWGGEARFYGQEEKNVSEFVKSSVDPGDEIYVLNYWDSIYAMTDTLPTTRPLIPYLPWYLEYEDKKEGITRDLISDMPEMVVKGEYSDGGLGSYSIDRIDTLLERYYTLAYKKANIQIYRLNK